MPLSPSGNGEQDDDMDNVTNIIDLMCTNTAYSQKHFGECALQSGKTACPSVDGDAHGHSAALDLFRIYNREFIQCLLTPSVSLLHFVSKQYCPEM